MKAMSAKSAAARYEWHFISIGGVFIANLDGQAADGG